MGRHQPPKDGLVMIACFDVHYLEDGANAACVLFHDWGDEAPCEQRVVRVNEIESYVPGRFYRRELPCILSVMEDLSERPDTVIVDGYVSLGPDGRPGLGARLYEALNREIPVIGVAKSAFKDTLGAIPVTRGTSRKSLFVTAAGIPVRVAADRIRAMHGPNRIPTLVRLADTLCRRPGG
jgi:deoxyribonuclease V